MLAQPAPELKAVITGTSLRFVCLAFVFLLKAQDPLAISLCVSLLLLLLLLFVH